MFHSSINIIQTATANSADAPDIDWGQISQVSQAFGAVLTAITIGFLIWQSRALSRSMKSQSYQAIVAMQVGVDKLLIENHFARPYLYGDKKLPKPTTEEGAKVHAIIDIAMNVIDNTYQQRDLLPKDMLESWIYFAMETSERPAVREFLKAHPDWYPIAHRGEYRKEYKRLTKG
ncbi:MAG: hypothetical protein RIQ31_368 [Actinomycetota bacterium]